MVSVLNSIDTLSAHPRKRDGTAMSEVGGAGWLWMSHPSARVEDRRGQPVAYTGDRTCGQKQKACDVNKELADDVGQKAVLKMMQRMQAENDRREVNLFSRLQFSLKSAAEDAVGRLSGTSFGF